MTRLPPVANKAPMPLVEESRSSVLFTLRQAWMMRRVWWFTATARTRARFARTVLGSFWLGLSNLLSIGVLALVYGTVFKVQNFNHYVVYLGIGLVCWNAISSAISAAPNLFEHNRGQVHNTSLHPIFYTLEEWSFQVQTFGQSFLLVIVALSFFQHNLLINLVLFSPLPIVNLLLFIYWLPLLVCLLGARYRDVYQVVPIALQLVFLLSPILYEKKSLGGLAWTADINPVYAVLSSVRHNLTVGSGQWKVGLLLLLFNVFGMWISVWLLNRERKYLPFLI